MYSISCYKEPLNFENTLYRTQTPYTFFGHKAFTAISYPGEGAKSQDEFTFPLIFFYHRKFSQQIKTPAILSIFYFQPFLIQFCFIFINIIPKCYRSRILPLKIKFYPLM
jgi:hypothetical protein